MKINKTTILFFLNITALLWRFGVSVAEIIEHPQTQYVLEGNNASFHCNAQGKKSYWRINNDTISIFHTTIRQRYISHGFTFLPPSIDRNQSYYNLTMHVLATSQTNNSRIECQVSSHNHSAESDAAYLIVFTEFSPGTFSDQAISHRVVFYPNGTPLLTIEIQLPSDLWPNQDINYTIIIESMTPDTIKLYGPHMHLGPGNVSHIIMDGIQRDANYSLRVQLDSLAGSSASNRYYFDTILDISPFESICETKAMAAKVLSYEVALGMSLSMIAIVFLALPLVFICIFLYRKKRRNHDKITISANNVCNSMVHNPIYDGPVYESVQRQFDTLTSTILQASQTSDSDTSLNQRCNSQSSTSTSSEKSVRYVDQPIQPPKPRSKSFASNDHSHSSISAYDAANVPRSTSVSVPTVTKKIGKQRNKLNLTITLNGNGPSEPNANKTCGPISAVSPVLRDEEDNYTVMSPAGQFVGGDKWSELTPEDTNKYKE